jgi:hypothetical protein
MTAKESYSSRMQNARNIIALLKQEATEGVDEDCAGYLPMLRCVHGFFLGADVIGSAA